MTAEAAHLLGLQVGETVPYGLFTDEQTSLPGMGTPSVQPHRRVDAKLVGLVALNSEIVQDEFAPVPAPGFMPALAKEVLGRVSWILSGWAGRTLSCLIVMI